ncbi:MAG TPA: PqqD family protein [Terriglobales bacterium]|nr:PqqD family protein [Terriglobales bacterium]
MERYVRSTSVVSRVIAGETLIVPVRQGVGDLSSIYSLNEVASLIWQAIAEPRTRTEIVQLLEQEFEAPSGQVEPDVESFLGEMRSAGLVSTQGASA